MAKIVNKFVNNALFDDFIDKIASKRTGFRQSIVIAHFQPIFENIFRAVFQLL